MVNSNATTLAQREKTDLLLQPPLAQVDMLNWKAFDRAIALGYEYTVRRLADPAQGCGYLQRRGAGVFMSDEERDWRAKYREALTRLSAEEARANKLENVLRLLVGRLCLAAQGRDARLDKELARVSSAVRKRPSRAARGTAGALVTGGNDAGRRRGGDADWRAHRA